MQSLAEIAARQQADGPGYFEDPVKDRMLRLVLELAEEVCVLRDRLETAELLGRGGAAPTPDAIDAFQPSTELTCERLARHQAYFEELLAGLGGSEHR